MTYDQQKSEVIAFFDNHVDKYLITDIIVLSKIQADEKGEGGCTIPQAITVFSAIDLCGYFIDPHPSSPRPVSMKLKAFLGDANFFPEFNSFPDLDDFLESLKDDIRSFLTHRFSMANYDIGKFSDPHLFLGKDSKKVFNVQYFTTKVIDAINTLESKIRNDTFIIGSDKTKEETMQKLWDRLQALKTHKGHAFIAGFSQALPGASITQQTTESLNR